MASVGEELPKEMARVRDHVLPHYDEIPEGKIGAMLIRRDLDVATKALAEGDIVQIIRSYEALKEIKA